MSGYLIDRYANWQLPFLVTMILMGLAVFLALRMRPERRFEPSCSVIGAAAGGHLP